MDDSLDLQTTYRAILDAARQGKYVSYGALAEANGAKWAKVRYKLNSQLGDIMKLAAERDWPIPSAIVVDQANLETGTLSDSAVKGFVGAARDLGFDVRDPQAFIAEQQRAMFAWAKGAPDELGPAAKPYLDRPLNTILYGPSGHREDLRHFLSGASGFVIGQQPGKRTTRSTPATASWLKKDAWSLSHSTSRTATRSSSRD